MIKLHKLIDRKALSLRSSKTDSQDLEGRVSIEKVHDFGTETALLHEVDGSLAPLVNLWSVATFSGDEAIEHRHLLSRRRTS